MRLNVAANEMYSAVAHQAVASTGGLGMGHDRCQTRVLCGHPEAFLATGVACLAEHVGLLGLRVVLACHSPSLGKGRVHLFDQALEERGRVVV